MGMNEFSWGRSISNCAVRKGFNKRVKGLRSVRWANLYSSLGSAQCWLLWGAQLSPETFRTLLAVKISWGSHATYGVAKVLWTGLGVCSTTDVGRILGNGAPQWCTHGACQSVSRIWTSVTWAAFPGPGPAWAMIAWLVVKWGERERKRRFLRFSQPDRICTLWN